MMSLLKFALLILLPVAAAVAGPKREESVFLFENRKLSIAVPDRFTYAVTKDDHGLTHMQLASPGDKVTLTLTFLPDPEGEFGNARARKEKLVELFEEFVGNSVEKAMRFEELDSKAGVGTYCVFTDANLVGIADLPAGEYRNFTTGLKAWPGVVAVFRLFSQDTASSEYQAAMKLLRESVQEKPVPLK